jgi:uncharacterized protein YciI
LLQSQAAFAQVDSTQESQSENRTYWIFLKTGKSTQGVERSELEKLQAAHLANFTRLFKEEKLFTAGPLADPQKMLRGIVVVTAPDAKSLPELFEPDPYVCQGYMTLDAIEMNVAAGEFRRDIDENLLAEYRLVLLEMAEANAREIDEEMAKENLNYCQSIHDDERLCLAAWLSEEKGPRRGILIFRKLDDGVLKPLVDEFPAVKSNAWRATTFPLYMSAGIVR